MIMSPETEINRIMWSRGKKGRRVKAVEIVVVPKSQLGGNEDMMVARLADGTFACSRDLSKAAYMPGSYPWIDPVLRALVALGAVSQGAMDRHMQLVTERDEEQRRMYDAECLRDMLAEHGLEPSADQLKFIGAHARPKGD